MLAAVSDPRPPSEAKQVLVVRKDLKMRKGKIAAQCAHASMRVLLDAMQVSVIEGGTRRVLDTAAGTALDRWLQGRFTKVCVYVESEEALVDVYERARARGIPAALITDSGRTEFGGVPTRTVVAVGPDWRGAIDEVTGGLKLL